MKANENKVLFSTYWFFEDDLDEHGLTDKVMKKHLVNIGDEVEKLCYL